MFLKYINWFRGLAIISVVLVHCTWIVEGDDKMATIYDAIFKNGTYRFVFISGFLFEHLKFNFQIGKYYISKLKNVVSPYILISVPAILYIVLGFKEGQEIYMTPEFLDSSEIEQVLYFYGTGHHLGPLWYIPVACLIFLISPALLYLSKKNILEWLLIPLVLLSIYFPRPDHTFSSPILLFLHFLSVYACGMITSKHKPLLILGRAWSVFLLGGFLILIVFLNITVDVKHFIFIQEIVLCILGINVLKYFEGKGSNFTLLNKIASTSFGIFFIHDYINFLFIKLFRIMDMGFLNRHVAFFMVSFIVLLISYYVVLLVKKVTGSKSRLFIGS